MSISAAMYAAVTGLSALSTGMQVISNNIANVNTVGFKAGRTNFEDLISQDYWSNGKIQQIGRGVKVASVQQMFTQGSFMNSAQDTDMAITGEGFFQVRDRVTNELMYTRAGNFTFDADGYLETPAGYVLQGWELSIPKPGEDAVRLGSPVDVKVVVLNAPPVETSQIKVVANLNADDSSAYIYDQLEWAELYASQVDTAKAEQARKNASDAVYSSAINGTTYTNSSPVFNQAYLDYMSAQGFKPTALNPLVFEKTEVVNPSQSELNQAANEASAAAWAWLGINGTYPITATNSSIYETAYNSAYSHYMVDTLGFTEYPTGTFFKINTRQSPNSTQITVAEGQALTAANLILPGYTGYPSGNAAADAAYANAYENAMTTALMVEPPDDFTSAATGTAAATAAAAAAATAAALAPNGIGVDALQSAAAFATSLAQAGYTINTSYPKPALPATSLIYKNPSSSELTAAQAAAQTMAGGAFGSLSTASQLVYAATYTATLQGQAAPYTGATTLALPATNQWYDGSSTYTLTTAEESAAIAAGLAANGNLAYVGDGRRSDNLYLAAYVKNVLNVHPSYTLDSSYGSVTDPGTTNFTRQPTALEVSTSQTAANNAATTFSNSVGNTWAGYATSTDNVANLVYVRAYVEALAAGGGVDSSYAGPIAPTAADFSRTPTAQELSDAHDAGLANVQTDPDAPSNYAFPTGNTTLDTLYRDGYNAYLTSQGYTGAASTDPTKYFRPIPSNPDAGQISQADAAAKTAAALAIGPVTSGYPLTTIEPNFGATYNSTYQAKMLSLGYTNISPQPLTAPFFEKSQVTAATTADYTAATEAAKTEAELLAKNAGQLAYDAQYNIDYQAALASISDSFAPWQLEGMGFAGAWDGTDLESPIDPESYTHANPWTIYDSLGNSHTLMVYYQPNPHMENVWDYVITCDPTEDARKDLNNTLVMNGSTFAGVIQKGKITFTADGPDRHGGLIKDIEAQNIDMTKTAAASLSSAVPNIHVAVASSINHATLDGYFTGQPVFSATTGTLVDNPRQYTLEWVGNLGTVPNVSGFTWTDNAGNSGTIPIYDKNYTGPYPFGSGLNVSFTEGGRPMAFTATDTLTFTAHSEQIGWTNINPNTEGYFDFDVAFVQSASMALHPPYPEGLPTITQHIALDMGARNPNGQNGSWILDEQGTTQYASESINVFSSQDGYPAGSLQRVSIDKDGVVTGVYTNGRHQPLYQIGLARFLNPWGLAKLGDNVYMETRWSGTGTINPPGYGGTGTIRANFLEQSNTDLADEIVNMIVTQRGFQANSKVVTTTDTMLAEVIEMKR
jgi:flagellar hook-basal body protein